MRGANAAMGRWSDKDFRWFWRRANFLGPARFPWNILYAANEIPRASDVSSVHRVVDVFQGEGI